MIVKNAIFEIVYESIELLLASNPSTGFTERKIKTVINKIKKKYFIILCHYFFDVDLFDVDLFDLK